jgi:DNA-binding winged helix-turn-helix (wHTH) protein/tetratricopeptide (TPR) repeat protein/TolB-like protein
MNEIHYVYEFGRFRLDAQKRLLLRDGCPIKLFPKEFDTLLALVEQSGELLDKDELMRKVWGKTIVEESNLSSNISHLRKALGETRDQHEYIVTVPGHGYRFVAEVKQAFDKVIVRERTRVTVEEEKTEELETTAEYSSLPLVRLNGDPTRPELAALAVEILPTNGKDEQLEEEFIAMRVVETEQGEEIGAGDEVSEARRRPALAVEHVPARLSAQTTPRRPPQMLRVALAAGVVLAGLILLAYSLWPKPPQSAMPIKSLAVLPFKPLVADSRDEAFEMGMADTLITTLGSLRGIAVRPLSAVRQYTDLAQDAVAAGREQQVDVVLDASYQRSRERIRVTVRLLNVADGSALWTYQCDEYFTDIFVVQHAISEKVAGVLALKLSGEERELLAKRYTDNPEAYQVYLKGRFFWQKRTGDGAKKAVAYFEQAIRLDPNYALAYAGLSDATAILGDSGFLPLEESRQKALALAMKALELDDTLAEAHATLALAIVDYHRNWSAGERHFRRAIALNPSYAEAHEWYASHLSCVGRHEEAIAEAQRAQELDPLSLNATQNLGHIFLNARQYDRAIEQLQTVLDLDPDHGLSHFLLGMVYMHTGKYEEASAEFQQVKRLSDTVGPGAVALLGYTYAIAGQRNKAKASLGELEELATRRYVAAFPRAVIYTGMGEKERAFEWLERAYAGRNWQLRFLKVSPLFDPLRSDPRFTDLLKRMGLGE